MDFEADRQPPEDSTPADHLITMVKKMVKKSFEKMKERETSYYPR